MFNFDAHPLQSLILKMNKVRTSISEIYIDNDGILYVEMFENADVTLEKVKENFDALKKLLGSDKALVLIKIKKGFKFHSDARRYAALAGNEINRVATAFVVNSFASKLVVNLYIKFNKPAVPTRMFLSEKNALKWLRSFYILPGDAFIKTKKEP